MPPSVGEILSSRGLSQLRGGASSGASAAVPKAACGPNAAAFSLSNGPAAAADAEAAGWLDWVQKGLPIELAAHVVQVLLKRGQMNGSERELTIFADSPAWCARLRYALLALEQHIRTRDPAIRRLSARVLRFG